MSARESCVIAALMNTRGLVELIVLNLGASPSLGPSHVTVLHDVLFLFFLSHDSMTLEFSVIKSSVIRQLIPSPLATHTHTAFNCYN